MSNYYLIFEFVHCILYMCIYVYGHTKAQVYTYNISCIDTEPMS